MYAKLNADESAVALTAKILAREPFFFLRYGDGALECISGVNGGTCDREKYSPALGLELLRTWCKVVRAPGVYIGDWMSAAFVAKTEPTRFRDEYAELIGTAEPNWLHFEALLLMRESADLVNFYAAVKRDQRRKAFMGPASHAGAAKMLGAEHIVTPMTEDLLGWFDHAAPKLWEMNFDVLLYGAGMASHVPVAQCWEFLPERTYVNVGSAMDPLFRGRTRQQQLDAHRARKLFAPLLGVRR